ncbi:MAG: hypothetical protein ABFR62_13475 [Bacteroidota bacterium]
MKRLKLVLSSLLLGQMAFAGGMVTNTNQSAAYIRMLARDASTDVDAVFYNPAGLTKLADGFYVQLNNQVITQERKITSSNPMLNNDTYIGDVFAPLFPSAFMAYKTGNWAFSGGFTVVGGGGSANFEEGLPSFEMPFASVPLALSGLKPAGIDVQGYDVDISLEGTSAYMGLQAGASYAINDMVSVYAGLRYVSIKNSYEGHIKDVQYTLNGTDVAPSVVFGQVAGLFNYAGNELQGLVDANAGGFTIDQVKAAGHISDEEYAQIVGGLGAVGVEDPGSMTISTAQATFYGAAGVMSATGDELEKDRELEAEQTGSGITPIIGANIALMDDNLNIGIKYEFKTTMDVTNNTTKDDTGMFPDKRVTAADMPAFLSVGIDYNATEKLKISTGLHYYWDKTADYGKNGYDSEGNYLRGDNSELIDGNSFEIALGLQYDINETFGISGGYLHASSGPTLAYQSELSYSLDSDTFSAGGVAHLTEKFDLDFGFLYTIYEGGGKEGLADDFGQVYDKTCDKSNWVAALGLTYKFGGE